jgi:hypothetical protein
MDICASAFLHTKMNGPPRVFETPAALTSRPSREISMATEHMNGVATNGNAESKGIPSKFVCERTLVEMKALATAIMAIGMAEDEGGPNGSMEAAITLAGMIRDRLDVFDRVLFPNGSAISDREAIQ